MEIDRHKADIKELKKNMVTQLEEERNNIKNIEHQLNKERDSTITTLSKLTGNMKGSIFKTMAELNTDMKNDFMTQKSEETIRQMFEVQKIIDCQFSILDSLNIQGYMEMVKNKFHNEQNPQLDLNEFISSIIIQEKNPMLKKLLLELSINHPTALEKILQTMLRYLYFDNEITSKELISYAPFSGSSLSHGSSIRIGIQNKDAILSLSESDLLIQGTIKKEDDSNITSALINNGIAHLFEVVSYKMNEKVICTVYNPGVASTLNSFALLSSDQVKGLSNASWISDGKLDGTKFNTTKDGEFLFTVPLSLLLPFFATYKKITTNAKHELILTRSRNDDNAVKSDSKINIDITKIVWRVPTIHLNDVARLHLLDLIKRNVTIDVAFRSYDLVTYPTLPTTHKHSWMVKSTNNLNVPRYVIFAMQTDKIDDFKKNNQIFDFNDLSSIRLFLNEQNNCRKLINNNTNTTPTTDNTITQQNTENPNNNTTHTEQINQNNPEKQTNKSEMQSIEPETNYRNESTNTIKKNEVPISSTTINNITENNEHLKKRTLSSSSRDSSDQINQTTKTPMQHIDNICSTSKTTEPMPKKTSTKANDKLKKKKSRTEYMPSISINILKAPMEKEPEKYIINFNTLNNILIESSGIKDISHIIKKYQINADDLSHTINSLYPLLDNPHAKTTFTKLIKKINLTQDINSTSADDD
ncbi:conserved oligomeric Golgi complex subunit 8-like [Chrysoperla carnea]|uniref:conserved oligomeric Golgi complex subunit 8-like n=1 Tax=Chrysoperla carnea TaxID=189513 RepID=UPI001D07E6FF|nr:conserved oligomeric Golgi complex subunit 8-like [Chrysoperla carnea]